MKKRGEITVFLSLTLVCILSLFMGLLESARTAWEQDCTYDGLPIQPWPLL